MRSFRLAVAADEPFLWTMLYEAAHAAEIGMTEQDLRSAPELARYVAGWGGAGDLGIVGGSDPTAPAGAAWLRLLTADNAGYGYVDDRTPELAIAVVAQERGSGLGTALLDRLLDEASSAYEAVCLSVLAANPARRLYERCGFTVVSESQTSDPSDSGSVTMLRRLR